MSMNIDTAYDLKLVPDEFNDNEHINLDAQLQFIPLREDTFAADGSVVLELITRQLASHNVARRASGSECEMLIGRYPKLRDMLLNGSKEGYRLVRRLKILRESDATSDKSADITLENDITTAVREAWRREYRGNHPQIMLNNINSMKRSTNHVNCVSIIQGSGSGKSRMADEASKWIFSIPFNLCSPGERRYDPFPFPDTIVWEYLCNNKKIKSVEEEEDRSALFLLLLFAEVDAEVRGVFGKMTNKKFTPPEFAQKWYTHLSSDNKRYELYARVIGNCRARLSQHPPSPLHQPRNSRELRDNLRRLLVTLDRHCAFKPGEVKILLYFDEAHELGRKITDNGKTLYDTLWSSLDKFKTDSVFTLFLSTQSSVPLLAPSALWARSMRQRSEDVLWGPITETPFDCHPSFPLRPGLYLEEVQTLEFLTRFGRPLFWTMLSGENNHELLKSMMELARQKLLLMDKISSHHPNVTDITKSVILDVLITIDYEPRRIDTHVREMEMVASHMRTAFSIPNHRSYIRSGYPSEPFLAEAASRQMHHFQTTHPGVPRFSMVHVLTKDLEHGLIDLGQRGEVCMRLLLREAYMKAVIAEQEVESGADPNFSVGCMFPGFLKALFAKQFHDQLLDCKPAGGATSSATLQTTFQNAVVRFTHFAKAADSSLISTRGTLRGFLRGAAIVGHNTQEGINIAIPILLDRAKKIEEASMSAFLIQVKRRRRPGSVNAYLIDAQKLNFFPEDSTEDVRPYVTLVAELGATKPLDHNVVIDHTRTRKSGHTPSLKVHPKFAIRAYKCGVETWGTIHPDDETHYSQLLCLDELLADHPRQDEVSLQLTKELLPFWDLDDMWLEDEDVNKIDEGDKDDEEGQVGEDDEDEQMKL